MGRRKKRKVVVAFYATEDVRISDGHSEIRISNKRDGSICQRWLYSCDDSIVEGIPPTI